MIVKEPELVALTTPFGPMRVHVYRPVAEGRYPGLVLYSEIFQVTGPISRTAAWLAGHGHVVAVPEIYHELEAPGSVLAYDTAGAERGNAHKVAKDLASYDADARATIAHLKSRPDCTGNLGAIGICIGGHLAFRCAMNREILAAVCFYATDLHKHGLGKGKNDDSLARTKEIQGELLMIWGRQDPHVPREGRQLVYNTLSDAGSLFTWHEFNGQHAFLRDEGARYDPELACLSFQLVRELFARRLGEGDRRVSTGGVAETKH